MLEKRTFTHDEVVGEFNNEVVRWINDSCRIPARKKPSKEEIYTYAKSIYQAKYKNAIHAFVLDKYNEL